MEYMRFLRQINSGLSLKRTNRKLWERVQQTQVQEQPLNNTAFGVEFSLLFTSYVPYKQPLRVEKFIDPSSNVSSPPIITVNDMINQDLMEFLTAWFESLVGVFVGEPRRPFPMANALIQGHPTNQKWELYDVWPVFITTTLGSSGIHTTVDFTAGHILQQ